MWLYKCSNGHEEKRHGKGKHRRICRKCKQALVLVGQCLPLEVVEELFNDAESRADFGLPEPGTTTPETTNVE